MKKLRKFRELMAEKGRELTPREAAADYRAARELRMMAREVSQLDLWKLEEFTENEKDQEAIELMYHARGTLC
jgi:hypothetical protein